MNAKETYTCRAGQNRIYARYMTVYLVILLPKTPYIHRICMVLANPIYLPLTTQIVLRSWLSNLQAVHGYIQKRSPPTNFGPSCPNICVIVKLSQSFNLPGQMIVNRGTNVHAGMCLQRTTVTGPGSLTIVSSGALLRTLWAHRPQSHSCCSARFGLRAVCVCVPVCACVCACVRMCVCVCVCVCSQQDCWVF
jgi:hypothetical protein